ncbi:ABC transporter permease [Dyella flava]|uniref:ABC transporter permease n=1 Tax=Dyella flava TaxID=1920170 RepID=A0ABS2K1T2_9GAMM|nr:ABC transporter permease [Dyella flava]MBM7125205.1 ABC transporter permease [Dyella flava]
MIKYYLQLALRSLRRNPVLTALMVIAIGFGVASSMTTYAVLHALSGDPIPWKSNKLFFPQIDAWGPNPHRNGHEPADAMTYIDAVSLMRDHRAHRQSALYPIAPTVRSDDPAQKSREAPGQAVASEFFPMLDVPFLYGSSWAAADDEQHAKVVVISKSLNQRLFRGVNSVGRSIQLNSHSYRVIGVLGDWHPQPKFYDLATTDAFGSTDQVFLPFTTATDAQLATKSGFFCINLPSPGYAAMLNSSCVWIGYMVELDTPSQVRDYRSYLDSYAREQRASGRFGWEPNNRLRDLSAWLDFEQVVPAQTKMSFVVALCLLLVCMVNTVGLLLAKFLLRSGEIGVRRALGANRIAIAIQFGVEAGAIGVTGGLLGLMLTWLGIQVTRAALPRQIADLAHIDWLLLWQTLLLAVVATILAALYPVWRAMCVRPSLQLKED